MLTPQLEGHPGNCTQYQLCIWGAVYTEEYPTLGIKRKTSALRTAHICLSCVKRGSTAYQGLLQLSGEVLSLGGLAYAPSKLHAPRIWDISPLTQQNCSRLHGESFTGFIYAFVPALWICLKQKVVVIRLANYSGTNTESLHYNYIYTYI